MQIWLQVKSEVKTCTMFGEKEARDWKLPLKVLKSSLVDEGLT
jgi:ABC-type cobalamin transport system permease subunit